MIRIALAGCGEHSRASHAAPLARFAARHPNEITLAEIVRMEADFVGWEQHAWDRDPYVVATSHQETGEGHQFFWTSAPCTKST